MSNEHPKTICFDFDGVCATYDGFKGVDVLGEPIVTTAALVRRLRTRGYICILWTTRPETPTMRKWLRGNGFIFDSINSSDHNPPDTSNKPIAKMYIDDRAFRFDPNESSRCCREIEEMLGGAK